MGKHRLSKKQQAAIKKMQQEKRERAIKQLDEYTAHENEQHGLLVAHFGQHLEIEDATGKIRRCMARKNLGPIAAGDKVIWHPEKHGDDVIVAVEPRTSELYRYHKLDGNKLVAANLDKLYIVVAPEPPRAINVIDRYIMLAEIQGIKPVIVFNKADLLDDQALTTMQDYLSYYQALGYPVYFTSNVNNDGINVLEHSLEDNTSIFVGLSGVGKSSLIKALLPDEIVAIGELSEKSREGNHTTTTAKLFHLPGGGNIIDCPGIRELAVGELTAQDVLYGFKDIAAVAANCQFRDCSHSHEPGCAVLAAADDPEFNHDRFLSYQNIIAELNNN